MSPLDVSRHIILLHFGLEREVQSKRPPDANVAFAASIGMTVHVSMRYVLGSEDVLLLTHSVMLMGRSRWGIKGEMTDMLLLLMSRDITVTCQRSRRYLKNIV